MSTRFLYGLAIGVVVFIAIILIFNLFAVQSNDPGEEAYNRYCANCHGANGAGVAAYIPPINRPEVFEEKLSEIACNIRYGLEGEIEVDGKVYNEAMPGNIDISEVEIANIINYMAETWGYEVEHISSSLVKKDLENCR